MRSMLEMRGLDDARWETVLQSWDWSDNDMSAVVIYLSLYK